PGLRRVELEVAIMNERVVALGDDGHGPLSPRVRRRDRVWRSVSCAFGLLMLVGERCTRRATGGKRGPHFVRKRSFGRWTSDKSHLRHHCQAIKIALHPEHLVPSSLDDLAAGQVDSLTARRKTSVRARVGRMHHPAPEKTTLGDRVKADQLKLHVGKGRKEAGEVLL